MISRGIRDRARIACALFPGPEALLRLSQTRATATRVENTTAGRSSGN
jgi:hypothetical protein